MAVCEHIVRKANSMAKKIGFLKMLNDSIVNFMYACAHTHYNTDTHTILNVHNSSFFWNACNNVQQIWQLKNFSPCLAWQSKQHQQMKSRMCVDQKWIFYQKETNENTSKTKKLFFYKKKLKKAAVIDSCCSAINLFEDTTLKHTHLHTTKKSN